MQANQSRLSKKLLAETYTGFKSATMKIEKQQLLQILVLTEKYLDGYLEENILIEKDPYMHIPGNKIDYVGKSEIAIGSLSDDWQSLRLLLEDKDRPFTCVDLDRIAAILTAISELINPC